MNQSVSNLPINSVGAMTVLDRRTLASLSASDLTESIYVHRDVKLNVGEKTGAIDYSLSNYLYIPSSIMAKAKGGRDWLVNELNQHKYFKGAKRTPSILQINDEETSADAVHLLNTIVSVIPDIAKSQETEQANHWLLLKLDGSYDVVYCGSSKKSCT